MKFSKSRAAACAVLFAFNAQAQTPAGGVQAVHDKDVFEQNKTLLKQAGENSVAVKELNATVQAALTRSRAMGKLAPSGAARLVVNDDGETDASIAATYAKVQALGCARPEKDGSVQPADRLAVCQKIEKASFNMVTMLRANLARSRQRAVLIDSLLVELDNTGAGNLKESADLAARIQVETALLQNEKNMVDMALANNEQQVRLYAQLLSNIDGNGAGDPTGNTFTLKRK